MLPYLTLSIDMLMKAFIDRFAVETESISLFYKVLVEEFSTAAQTLIKDKCVDYLIRVVKRLDRQLLSSLQSSLESVLRNSYFLQEEARQKAVALAEYLEEHIAEDDMNSYIYTEFLAENNTVDRVLGKDLDRRKTVRANSIISESGFGDSFISDFQNEAADMNLNFDDFKSALKAESKIDRIEAFMNLEDILIASNGTIRSFLNKKDNLEVFVSLIARPHEVESRVWWKPVQRLNLEALEIFEDFREFNLKNANNYFLYDSRSLNKLEYINKNAELKNVYRSYNALMIILAKDNLELILNRFEGSLEKIVITLRDAFEVKNNANIEHALILLRALICERPNEVMRVILGEKKILLPMLLLLENRCVLKFLQQVLFRPQTLMLD